MTRPTDAAIARAFWAAYDSAGDLPMSLLDIAADAEQFDAESPAGTGCKVCGGGAVYCMFCADRIRAMPTIPEKVPTSPERVQIPSESTHVRCPKCTGSILAGKWCNGPNCPLRK